MVQALKVHGRDNVATALTTSYAGDVLADVRLLDAVPQGHKFATAPIATGQDVVKFGSVIGQASRPIAEGEHVHSHNLHTGLGALHAYRYSPVTALTASEPGDGMMFRGYVRADGRVATRNEIWVLPTVGCVARTAQRIAARAEATYGDRVDGVHAFTHPHGCSQLGADLGGTRAILASLACHPNAAGVLLVGLGCEENQLASLLADIPAERHAAIRTLSAQASAAEIEEGVALIGDLIEAAGAATRVPVGIDRLVLGVKCGGSDGLSGLTANPLVGRISDRVTQGGGSVVLTEIPEIFGAEQALMDRAADRDVFDRIVGMVNGFKRYFIDHGEPVSENPSPGNVAGGITTLEEKSLGAVQKGGDAIVTDVIGYGKRVSRDGLTLLEAPGNDAVSSTALAAAGATAILFTTGRGTPLGFPVPTIKISSNSDLARRKPDWIDFDAGKVLDDGFEAAEEALLARIAAIASGEQTAAERNDEREIAIWKRGVTL